MAKGIVLEFNTSGGMAIKGLDGEVASWDEALMGAVAFLRHAVERAFFATGRTTVAGQRLSAAAEALAGVSMAQWYADLATPADKAAEAVLDWRECHPEATPCCARLENARAWATGG